MDLGTPSISLITTPVAWATIGAFIDDSLGEKSARFSGGLGGVQSEGGSMASPQMEGTYRRSKPRVTRPIHGPDDP